MTYKLNKQHRLPGFDYSRAGYYFITICTNDRKCYFGNIVQDKMKLSAIGEIAGMFWMEIPKRFENVILDAWVIMPNHIHGVVVIENDDRDLGCGDQNMGFVDVGDIRDKVDKIDMIDLVGTRRGAFPLVFKIIPTQDPTILGIHPLIKNSISSIINHYKGNVKRYCNKNNLAFAWQSRFHDRIIRNERALGAIRRYIIENPAKWGRDRNSIK